MHSFLQFEILECVEELEAKCRRDNCHEHQTTTPFIHIVRHDADVALLFMNTMVDTCHDDLRMREKEERAVFNFLFFEVINLSATKYRKLNTAQDRHYTSHKPTTTRQK